MNSSVNDPEASKEKMGLSGYIRAYLTVCFDNQTVFPDPDLPIMSPLFVKLAE